MLNEVPLTIYNRIIFFFCKFHAIFFQKINKFHQLKKIEFCFRFQQLFFFKIGGSVLLRIKKLTRSLTDSSVNFRKPPFR